MATSIFDEKAIIPNDSMIAITLSDKKILWDKLESHILENYKAVKKDWKFYSKKAGWTLVFKSKDRTLLYFIPCEGYFKVWFVFSEKAINLAKQASLPEYIVETICSANSYVEGTSFGFDIKVDNDICVATILLKIKNES